MQRRIATGNTDSGYAIALMGQYASRLGYAIALMGQYASRLGYAIAPMGQYASRLGYAIAPHRGAIRFAARLCARLRCAHTPCIDAGAMAAPATPWPTFAIPKTNPAVAVSPPAHIAMNTLDAWGA